MLDMGTGEKRLSILSVIFLVSDHLRKNKFCLNLGLFLEIATKVLLLKKGWISWEAEWN